MQFFKLYISSLLIFLFSGVAIAQNAGFNLNEYLLDLEQEKREKLTLKFENELGKIIEKLDKKVDRKKAERFIEILYRKIHNKVLKNYSSYVPFSTMIENGYYDCLTATALYSKLLNRYGLEHSIIASEFHVLIVLQVNEKIIALETTDPLNGIIEGQEAVSNHLKFLLAKDEEILKQQNDSRDIKLVKLNAKQLSAYYYYNRGVSYFQNKDYLNAMSYADLAYANYPSERFAALRHLSFEQYQSFTASK